jgi:predicted short-subunit dehydrogenase-like oxidoreductase (DUF2520 family)
VDHPVTVVAAADEAEVAVADPADQADQADRVVRVVPAARVDLAVRVAVAKVSAAEAVVLGATGRRNEKIQVSKNA